MYPVIEVLLVSSKNKPFSALRTGDARVSYRFQEASASAGTGSLYDWGAVDVMREEDRS
jgi:hypothetical protein